MVLCPFLALQASHARSARNLGIPAHVWKNVCSEDQLSFQTSWLVQSQAHAPHNIVFITPEAANAGAFLKFLTNVTQKIGLIVADEAHLILEPFRHPYLQFLQQHVIQDHQKLFLTATLPPPLLPHLKSMLSLTSLDVVRGTANRSNLAVHVRELNDTIHHEQVGFILGLTG